MAPFRAPDWAAQPTRTSSLATPDGSTHAIDAAPATVLGGAGADIDVGVSGDVAALVHHANGKCYLIALDPSITITLDGTPLPLHKPTAVTVPGSRIAIAGVGGDFVLAGEGAAVAKRGRDGGDAGHAPTSTGPATVRASHLLVKHAGSRRPSSWKEPVVTRSLEDARTMVAAFRDQIARGAVSFDQLASTESHCSSARAGGDLGVFGRGQMQRAFEDAAFGLAVGELSGLVETDSGVHIILRTA
jgi:peptidyl-prolyl cis-trans isomerase NIMA-interacting 1